MRIDVLFNEKSRFCFCFKKPREVHWRVELFSAAGSMGFSSEARPV